MSRASSELFGPVAGGRLAAAIVEQIREAIFSGRLSPGERLPSEREFAKIFGASAVVVREALHTLEAAGLLEIRYGTTGGAFVAELTLRPLTESLSTLLRAGKTTIAQITEARLVIEPEIAGFAAVRRRAKLLAPLERNLEETATMLGRIREARLLNLEYHKLLVEITSNPFFIACLCSLIENLEGNTAYMDLNMGAVTDTLEYHQRIFRAVKRGDAAEAARQMRRHIVHIHRGMVRAKRAATGR